MIEPGADDTAELKRIAYHESGHVVLHDVLRCGTPERLLIGDTPERNSSGHFVSLYLMQLNDDGITPDKLSRAAAIFAAGSAAEIIHEIIDRDEGPDSLEWISVPATAENDFQQLLSMYAQFYGRSHVTEDDEDVDTFLPHAHYAAVGLLCDSWAHVDALARCALKSDTLALSKDEIRSVIWEAAPEIYLQRINEIREYWNPDIKRSRKALDLSDSGQ